MLGAQPEALRGGLNLVETAYLLGVAPSTLRQRALAGKVSHARDGRRWIFSWLDIAEYLGSRWVPSEKSRPVEAEPRADSRLDPFRTDDTITAEARELGLL